MLLKQENFLESHFLPNFWSMHEREQARRNWRNVSLCLSAAILTAAFAWLFGIEAELLPDNVPDSSKLTLDVEFNAAAMSIDAIKDQISLLVSVCFGLSAVVGYCVTVSRVWQMASTPLLLSIFLAALTHSIANASYGFSAIAVQSFEHFLFLGIIKTFVDRLAICTLVAAGCTFLLLSLRLFGDDAR